MGSQRELDGGPSSSEEMATEARLFLGVGEQQSPTFLLPITGVMAHVSVINGQREKSDSHFFYFTEAFRHEGLESRRTFMYTPILWVRVCTCACTHVEARGSALGTVPPNAVHLGSPPDNDL